MSEWKLYSKTYFEEFIKKPRENYRVNRLKIEIILAKKLQIEAECILCTVNSQPGIA